MTFQQIKSNTLDMQQGLVLERLVHMLIATIVVFCLMYGYFVASTVHHVISRSTHEKQTQNLTSDIAKLEVTYLKLTEDLTIDKGQQFGLSEARTISYVDRAPSRVSFASNVVDHEF